MSEDSSSRRKGYTGLVIAGCLLTGLGLGFVFHSVPAGLFIGLGVGLLIAAVMRLRIGEW